MFLAISVGGTARHFVGAARLTVFLIRQLLYSGLAFLVSKQGFFSSQVDRVRWQSLANIFYSSTVPWHRTEPWIRLPFAPYRHQGTSLVTNGNPGPDNLRAHGTDRTSDAKHRGTDRTSDAKHRSHRTSTKALPWSRTIFRHQPRCQSQVLYPFYSPPDARERWTARGVLSGEGWHTAQPETKSQLACSRHERRAIQAIQLYH